MKKISVVIPCYNSQNYLKSTVDRICNLLKGKDYEIILVNDCSSDSTIDTIVSIVNENNNILGIDLAHNTGQHNATMAGFHYVTGDYVLTCADDGQSPIEKWDEMIKALDDGYDVSTIRYEERGKRSFHRKIGSKISRLFSKWLIEQPEQGGVAFEFAAKRFIIDEMIRYQSPYASMNGLVLRATWNLKVILCDQHQREEGKSGYTFKKLVRLFLNQSTAFSIKPLRLSSVIGCAVASIGFIMGLITFIRKMIGEDILPGYSSTTIILLIGLGLIMIMLGLIGEYVGRIYMVINASPQYVVRNEIRKN